ncbi:hypothetical protein CGZ94_14535 [Enemella evansiae]|uniref:Tetratricopeptide repeat protein n=1 Tax=Enemella evansiae TaxID=2016499 RepID=A0A255G6S5_9ACTN|nr:hypothetical protein [Enemella evansiae]OYO11637.1 hypothetical protein CGZ94_14535 [Enemella evansiae]
MDADTERLEAELEICEEEYLSGQTDEAAHRWQQIWDAMPEPRTRPSYLSQVGSVLATRIAIARGEYPQAQQWLLRALEAYRGEPTSETDLLLGVLRFEAGSDNGRQVLATVLAKWGPRAFAGEDPRYLRIARAEC